MSEENTSTELDVSAAGARIAALMTGGPSTKPSAQSKEVDAPLVDDDKELSANADDLGQSESDATENVENELDDDDDENEQSDEDRDAIVLPKSLKNPEDQKAFRELPPDARKLFSKLHDIRESEQNKHFDQRMQQVAEERRQLQAAANTVAAERAEREQRLQTLARMTVPEIEQLKGINWDHLAAYDRDEYVRLSHVANQVVARAQAIQGELTTLQNQKSAEYQNAVGAHRTQQVKVALETIPEWAYMTDDQGNVSFKDQRKADALGNGIASLLKSKGFDDNDIPAIWQDARIISLLRDHVLLRQDKIAQTGAAAKKSNASAPTFMKPSTPSSQTDGKSRKYKDQKSNFQKTNSLEDAGRLIGMMFR